LASPSNVDSYFSTENPLLSLVAWFSEDADLALTSTVVLG